MKALLNNIKNYIDRYNKLYEEHPELASMVVLQTAGMYYC